MRTGSGIAVLLTLAFLGGCGGDDEVSTAPATGTWSTARLEGVAGATALAALGGRLLVATAGARELRVVDVEHVEAGAVLESRALPLDVDESLHLLGSGSFAAQGYQVGDLWPQGVDFQGLAAQAPSYVFVGERSYRVVYAGRIRQGPDRSWRSLWIERVFTVPGADRTDASASDWHDKGPGLAGLAAVKGERRSADLYVVDRGQADAGTFQVLEMDRFGLALKQFTVELAGPVDPQVGGILREEGRHVVVRGPDRGTLHPVKDAKWRATVPAGRGSPGPEGGPWRGMARSTDGTWWLVSDGDPATLAWRRP